MKDKWRNDLSTVSVWTAIAACIASCFLFYFFLIRELGWENRVHVIWVARYMESWRHAWACLWRKCMIMNDMFCTVLLVIIHTHTQQQKRWKKLKKRKELQMLSIKLSSKLTLYYNFVWLFCCSCFFLLSFSYFDRRCFVPISEMSCSAVQPFVISKTLTILVEMNLGRVNERAFGWTRMWLK